MASPIATYSFLPWLRHGIANQIQAGPTNVRATVKVKLEIKGTGIDADDVATVERDVSLYGPGDIVGIDAKAIVRTEPRHWITNFEPNYLPFLEFYDEDFPWRYTPAAVDGHRLTPWITLLILEEGTEFDEGKNILNRPLPFISIKGDMTKVLPRHDELWAWAHVHVNQGLHGSVFTEDMNTVLGNLENVLNQNPDLAYSRLLNPRDLVPDKTYHAFVVPTFETGRLAGLGLEIPDNLPATAPAWGGVAGPEAASLPYYFRWQFRTGAMGDFEYLVRLLVPRPMDTRVGQRDMDIQKPGAALPNLGVLNDILRLGGALRVPYQTMLPADKAEFDLYDLWATPPDNPYPQPFQQRLAALVNLADDYSQVDATTANSDADQPPAPTDDSDDPVITPPIYGRWHAAVSRVLKERDGTTDLPFNQNWVHDLNLDPRYRVAAGFGTRVMQENQENYMDKAWEQLGDVLEANRHLRRGQFALAVGRQWHTKYVAAMAAKQPEKLILFSAPVQRRVMAEGLTLGYRVDISPLTRTAVSTPLRKALRPSGRIMKLSGLRGPVPATQNLLTRWNRGEITPAPPKVLAPGRPTIDQVADQIRPQNVPDWLLKLLQQNPWLPWAVLGLGVFIFLLFLMVGAGALGIAFGAAIAGGAFLLFRKMQEWQKQNAVADSLSEKGRTPAAVDRLPKSPDFRLAEPGSGFKSSIGSVDSVEGANFKTALRGLYTFQQSLVNFPLEPAPVPLNFTTAVQTTVLSIEPSKTIPKSIFGQLLIPQRILDVLVLDFDDVMEYPKIDLPMYEPLRDISAELFLPNIHLIEPNTISLLETNQKFIEAYMVGLNHEMARELLWREFPTDQRGSYFRQFWDIRAYLNPNDPLSEARREELFDIEEIHAWPKNSDLGKNDPKDANAPPKEEVVVVIRGELLKRYPNAVIYAHRADWRRVGDVPGGAIDRSRPRILLEIPAAEEANPPRTKLKTPLYSAQVLPDIHFFGFDLTIEQANGETPPTPDDPGWFFVIKERPGEPRFGLDEGKNNIFRTWNDLGWGDVQEENVFLRAAQNNLHITTGGADDPQGTLTQMNEDKEIQWTNASNAADIAYILYQVPVLVAVHASEMLPKP